MFQIHCCFTIKVRIQTTLRSRSVCYIQRLNIPVVGNIAWWNNYVRCLQHINIHNRRHLEDVIMERGTVDVNLISQIISKR